MKTYEKPRLMVLSISANDVLCGGCGYATKGDGLLGMFDTNGNGYLDSGDFNQAKNDYLFTVETDTCATPYESYCKYNHDITLLTS